MADEVENPTGGAPVDQTDILALIAELLGDNEEGAARLTEAYEFERDLNKETVSGLENRNGDAMTQLAAMEADRDALNARVEALSAELQATRAQNWVKLMSGNVETNDDNIADVPDEDADGDPDVTPDDLLEKYTEN